MRFDVLIDSEDSQGLWLALKLKGLGLKVGWVNPSLSYASPLYYPYFMGVFTDPLLSAEFEFVSRIYHIIKNPFGFSLMTERGPIDFGSGSLIDFYRFRVGMDSNKFDQWLQKRVTELICNHYKESSFDLKFNVLGSFAYLYPKNVLLTDTLEANEVTIVTANEPPVFKKNYYWVGEYHSKVWVSSRSNQSLKGVGASQDVWLRARLNVRDLWTRYPGLPGWTLWRNTEDVLTLYDSLFVLVRVFDDPQWADLYFKLPIEFRTEKEHVSVVNLITQKLKHRLPGSHFQVKSLEITPFEVRTHSLPKDSQPKKARGLFFNTPIQRPSWGINHHLNFETQLGGEIQTYLKKMEAKGAYRD
jgi:hypothetical protein